MSKPERACHRSPGRLRLRGLKLRELKAFAAITTATLLLYSSICLFLYFRQRQLIYRPDPELSLLPSTPDFDMPYQDVWIAIENDQIHSWWIPADESQLFSVLDNEPAHVLSQPKVMLYFCGVGNNMGDYNYLSRAAAFRQLGFSVLMFDYRGYGRSEGDFPHEAQLYADSEAVWAYLRNERGVAAADILIYGESMGGAIALNLAINHPDASGLIMQSSFTSMAAAIKHRPLASLFPIDGILHEAFNSIDKIEHLKMPVLFIHGPEDSVVPVSLSQALYEKAPAAKQLARIPNADHVSIYRPEASYFKTIDQFVRDVIGQDVTVRDVRQ